MQSNNDKFRRSISQYEGAIDWNQVWGRWYNIGPKYHSVQSILTNVSNSCFRIYDELLAQ